MTVFSGRSYPGIGSTAIPGCFIIMRQLTGKFTYIFLNGFLKGEQPAAVFTGTHLLLVVEIDTISAFRAFEWYYCHVYLRSIRTAVFLDQLRIHDAMVS